MSNSIIDQRNRLTLSFLWAFPFGKGQKYLNTGGVTNAILGGWQINGILFTQSGLWFSPVLQHPRPTPVHQAGLTSLVRSAIRKLLLHWFSPSAYSTPAPYTYGNAESQLADWAGQDEL